MSRDNGVLDLDVRPKDEVLQAAPRDVLMFERLARDPSIDVDKLDRLMQMHERVTAKAAESAFNAAMSTAQSAMRRVEADATNPQTKSRYASYGALDRALRPIYTDHGFGLSFDTGESPREDWIRVLCYVTHRDGHARTYHADMPADGKGAKGGDVMTKTHAVGAAMSYGMRYLLKMVFNVAVGEDDDDGNSATRKAEKPAPAGYDDWLADLQATADQGTAALKEMWRTSKGEYRNHLTETAPSWWLALKTKAQRVKA